MDAQRTASRVALIVMAAAVVLAVIAITGAFLLAVLVPGATDPAGWGTPPAIAFAAAMLAGFLAAAVSALLAGRLLASAAGRPDDSPDAIVLAVFTAIGAAVVALWAFGVGIGIDAAQQWPTAVMTGAGVVALLGALAAAALISDRLRRGSSAQE